MCVAATALTVAAFGCSSSSSSSSAPPTTTRAAASTTTVGSVASTLKAGDQYVALGSSIASIYARDAYTSRRGLLSLQALYGDRFILGLGVSHVQMVEGLRGHKYEKPVQAMRAYLDLVFARGRAT